MRSACFALLLLPAAIACASDDSAAPSGDGGARDAPFDSAPPETSVDASTQADAPSDVSPFDAAPVDAVSDAALDAPPCADPLSATTPIDANILTSIGFSCSYVYEISGTVVVDNGATLTIASGTTVVMDDGASLLIAPGSKLVAIGTRERPIVFTSAKPPAARARGDWGTLALVGKAPGNWGIDGSGKAITQHTPDANDWPAPGFPLTAGGTDNNYADGSGTLRYVRIEYGGRPKNASGAATDHEMLGLYGVGNGTRLDYIDMRQGNFGCLFAEGGAFDASHLLCQASGNGGFDFTRGNKSRVQFVVDQELPTVGAEGIGIKGPFDDNQLPPLTDPKIYNATVCGANGGTSDKDPYGLFLRRQPAGQIYDFIAMGFRAGISMKADALADGGAAVATTQLRSSILFGNFDPTLDGGSTNIGYSGALNDTDLTAWFTNPQWHNATTDPGIAGCFDRATLHMGPAASLTANAAAPPNDGFFDASAAFIGAFKDTSDAWASGPWALWSEQ